MTLDLRSASSLSTGGLAELFTRAYVDYVVPFAISEQQLRSMVEAYDLDLDGSSVAYIDNAPVGLCNLAVRGERGWIFGVGVVPEARRQRIGEQLVDAVHAAARERGVRRMQLEVIVGNDSAATLYEKVGYRTTRELEVWTLEQRPGSRDELPWQEAHAAIRAARGDDEPWQRADGTLEPGENLVGLRAGGGAAVVRVANERAQLLQATDEGAAELVAAAATLGPVAALNLPAGGPLAAAFSSVGGTLAVRQNEMALDL